MKNFSVKVEGKEYWISRSVATCTFVFKIKGDELFVLVEKRGKGAADNQGKLCSVCGYLDFDENLTDCAIRELKEETGFIANKDRLQFMYINSEPESDSKQNVTVHYVYFAKSNENFDTDRAVGGEENEVSEVKWFKVGTFNKSFSKKSNDKMILNVKVYNIMAEDWAFNHDKIMIEHLAKFFRLSYDKEEKEKQPD